MTLNQCAIWTLNRGPLCSYNLTSSSSEKVLGPILSTVTLWKRYIYTCEEGSMYRIKTSCLGSELETWTSADATLEGIKAGSSRDVLLKGRKGRSLNSKTLQLKTALIIGPDNLTGTLFMFALPFSPKRRRPESTKSFDVSRHFSIQNLLFFYHNDIMK